MIVLDKLLLMPTKQKFRIVLLASLVLLYSIYLLALEPTIDAYILHKELTVSSSQSISQKTVDQLKSKLQEIESLLKSSENDESILRKKILNQVATKSASEGVKIVQILEANVVKQDGFTTVFNTFEVQGNFERLNKFLYSLENEITDARIVSTNFQTKMNRTTKNKELTLTIYFQSIIF